jgi:hypothetical protein
MPTLERTVFETSRAAEYFNATELQAQTGQPLDRFAAVALKPGGLFLLKGRQPPRYDCNFW